MCYYKNMSEMSYGGENNKDINRPNVFQREINGKAVELLSHILPFWLNKTYAMQKQADESLQELELSLYKKTNIRENEIPRLRVRLEPHQLSQPIMYLNLGVLIEISIVVPLTFIKELGEIDGIELAMFEVKIATHKGTRVRKLVLTPTSLDKYINFDELVIEYAKDLSHSGLDWVQSIEEVTTTDSQLLSDYPEAETAMSGFRALFEKYKKKSILHQLEEIRLIKKLLESDEYLKVGNQ